MEVHCGFVFEGFERRFLQTNTWVPREAHQVLLLGLVAFQNCGPELLVQLFVCPQSSVFW